MKKYLLNLLILPLLFICLVTACKKDSKMASQSQKPNIIYILADDLGYGDLSCYGQGKFKTPNIDRLAGEGMRFMQHYAGATVCAPSRSSLMTGLHTGHTFVRGNRRVNPEGQYPIPDIAYTVAEMMKEAGYVTGAFGKWGLGYPESEGDPNHQGFDQFYGYVSQTLAHSYYPWYLWDNQEKVMLPENEGAKKGAYAPELIQKKTLAFLEQHKDSTFFLYVPSVIPHAELVAPEEYMTQFGEKPSPEQPYFKSMFAPEKPYQGTDNVNHPRFKKEDYGSQAHPHAAFAAMVTVLDDQVGEIMDKVKELGLDENTLIIFTSDNGPHTAGGHDPDFFNSNGPLKGYKRDLYEGGIRVPMIARWPGKIKAGSESDHISAFWDMMPTLAEVAGAAKPGNVDGISFLPTLFGEENQQEHEYLYWEFHEQGRKQAVRMGNWKAVRTGIAKNLDAPIELYDLSVDIGEEHNIADQHPEVVIEMKNIMQHAHEEDSAWPFFAERKNN